MSKSDKICCNNSGNDDDDMNKLKVLCIHGYRQNAEVFRLKTGSFRKMNHKWAQFNYITAPHKVILVDNVEEPNMGQSKDEEQYGWFFNKDDKTYRGIRQGGPAIGFEESVQLIEDIFEKEGPFDGILGFSQGGCFLGLLCSLQQRGLTKNIKFKFAIFAGAFKSQTLPHLKYYLDEIKLPSLHIYGENDQIIPTEMSKNLAKNFYEPVEVSHEGGHYLPSSAAQKHIYQKFFKIQLMERSEETENTTVN